MSASRVASGTPVGRLLKASRVNYIIEGAELAHRQATGAGAPTSRGPRAGLALIRNDAGQDLDRFAILGITGPLIDPDLSQEAEREYQNNFGFIGEKPDTDRDGAGRIAILQAPCEKGKLALAVVSGLTPVYLELDDDEVYTTADLLDDDTTQLTAGSGGIVVVTHQQGPGRKLAIVNLGAGGSCPLVHELYVDGNPTTGTQVWNYTIDGDSQDVTVAYDDEDVDVKAAFTAAFPSINSDQITVAGGPSPNVAHYIQFAGALNVLWPPVQGTTTLNNGAAFKLRKSGGD